MLDGISGSLLELYHCQLYKGCMSRLYKMLLNLVTCSEVITLTPVMCIIITMSICSPQL